ncbi:MAG: hypothetical protein R3Y53_00450 [Bacillota bacterium]
MRMCTRCNIEMLEGFDLKIDGGGYGLNLIAKHKMFGSRLGVPNVAVCSECGEISIYLEDVEKIKEVEKARVKKAPEEASPAEAPKEEVADDTPAPPEEPPIPPADPPE